MSDDETRAKAVATVGRLHEAVGVMTAPLVSLHEERLQCRRGCAGCCVDDLSVFEVEAERIRSAHPELLAQGAPHPAGGCAFLDEAGGCRVYEARPYVCRTQGLPLRWLEALDEETVVERRDICPLNEAGAPIEELPQDALWLLGPIEQQLAGLQALYADGELTRVTLRGLFEAR